MYKTDEELANAFSKKLKSLRSEYNMKQQDLAEKISVSRSKVAAWEQCTRVPSLEEVILLCNLFNKDIVDIYPSKEYEDRCNNMFHPTYDSFANTKNIRINSVLYGKIEQMAKQEYRTMELQVEYLLNKALLENGKKNRRE